MEDWDLDEFWDWGEVDDGPGFLLEVTAELAERVFLNDDDYLPNAVEDYRLGYLEPEDWWPLVNQLDELVDLEAIVDVLGNLDDLLRLPGLPTELLEAPLSFLAGALAGNLPEERAGRPVGSRKLVKIARVVIDLAQQFPDAAQAAVRAWANVHRSNIAPAVFDEDSLAELLFAADLPPALNGFSMMIGLTLMCWPERAEGLPLPTPLLDPELFAEVLAQWETLPDSPPVTEEGAGEAEALFAQGQLAYMLAQMGTMELMASSEVDGAGDEDLALAYSRLSRAVLWVHSQCRRCPERDGVSCRAATNWSEHPVPLVDVAGEIANTGRIAGCVRM